MRSMQYVTGNEGLLHSSQGSYAPGAKEKLAVPGMPMKHMSKWAASGVTCTEP